MTSQPRTLSVRLKDLGFALGNQMKLYGQRYQIDSEPMVVTEGLVLVDAIEMKSGDRKRIRIPLPVLKIASERAA